MKRPELEALDKSDLVALAEAQAARIDELEARLAGVDARFEELERKAMRGAAPFARSDGKRSKAPKRPGRKGGHEGAFRVRPEDDAVDRWIDVPLERCPGCGGALDPDTDAAIEQTIIEIPPAAPEIVRLTTHRNRCCGCGLRAASSHPLQMSSARGAAATHLGPRTLALAAALNKGLGLTMRKTCAALRELAGLTLTPGGLSQALARMATRLRPSHDALVARVRAQPVLHADETSWYVGRPGYSLWVMTNAAGTCYRIVPSRSKDAAEALLGGYPGVLVSDCLNIYDDLTPVQQKCYAHHLKKIAEALQGAGAGSAWLADLRGLLTGAMALKAVLPDMPADRIAAMRAALEASADRLLAAPRDGPEERVRLRLAKQRDHLFTFLDHRDVDPTNNLAERQLRPAVISRKLSCGNKTDAGARTWEVLSSIAATCQQNGLSLVDEIVRQLTRPTRYDAAR
jgi:hypothetical protein